MNEKPLRVAQIVGKWVGGGVESVLMNYYTHIDRRKVQFDFICDEDSTDIPYEKIKSLGGKVILVPPYQKIFKYQKELKKVLARGKYKIVHSHINALSIFPLRAAKKVKIKIRIAHSHSTSNKKEWKRNIIKNILRIFSKAYATDYMCCSEHAGRWLFGHKEYEKGNIYVLNNAIDIDDFKYDKKIRENVRKELNVSRDIKIIGNIGRFVTQKNHSFIIDIFSEVYKKEKNTVLVLVGKGPLMNEMKQKVRKLGLDDAVLFLGQRQDANNLYQAFDLLLFPSIYEGLGMVVIEAQCSGLLSLCSQEVPSKVKLCDKVEFLSLAESNEVWAKKVIEMLHRNNNRLLDSNIFKNKGYDIKIEASKLVEKYKKLEKV